MYLFQRRFKHTFKHFFLLGFVLRKILLCYMYILNFNRYYISCNWNHLIWFIISFFHYFVCHAYIFGGLRRSPWFSLTYPKLLLPFTTSNSLTLTARQLIYFCTANPNLFSLSSPVPVSLCRFPLADSHAPLPLPIPL